MEMWSVVFFDLDLIDIPGYNKYSKLNKAQTGICIITLVVGVLCSQ